MMLEDWWIAHRAQVYMLPAAWLAICIAVFIIYRREKRNGN